MTTQRVSFWLGPLDRHYREVPVVDGVLPPAVDVVDGQWDVIHPVDPDAPAVEGRHRYVWQLLMGPDLPSYWSAIGMEEHGWS